jgi:hypothetical protein
MSHQYQTILLFEILSFSKIQSPGGVSLERCGMDENSAGF